MDAGRFREAKRIFGAALEREPADRHEYVRRACAGDEDLRKDVESLLDCRGEAGAFLEEPPLAPRPGVAPPSQERSPDLSGRTLSHYEILDRIGEGGMGIVYRARDTRLGRLVALKILPPGKVADPDRMRRFVQEARAASALNHPNIVTIHDIDTADGLTFIVMEYVRGQTLDRLIRAGRAAVSDTVRGGAQIADALAAAHGAGIVHRDVKPANIMVTDSGLVKVLDFGLAKLNAPAAETAVSISAAPPSDEGLILGTVAYMSPEQARGQEIDHRSDIFSLGAVLYEMATGRRAFPGESSASTVAAILAAEPQSVRGLAADAPQALEQVIGRCLEKDPARRFQQAADLKAALDRLVATAERGPVRPGRRRRAWGAAALLVVAAGFVAWRVVRSQPEGSDPLVSTLAVGPGSQIQPALTRDGTEVAFVWNGDIYAQRIGNMTARQLTSSPALESAPAWSPDASRVVFLRRAASGTEVLVVPASGGPERRLLVSSIDCGTMLAKLYCGPSWSPDGRFITVADRESPGGASSVFLLDVQTGEKRRMTAPSKGFEDGMSAFSPDGRRLAFSRRPGPWPLSDLYVMPLHGDLRPSGDASRITIDNSFIWGFDWAEDGRSVIFASSRGGVDSLWRVPDSGGTPEALRVSGSDAFYPSLSRTGNRLAYSYGRPNMRLWRMPAPGAKLPAGSIPSPTRITFSPRWDQHPALSPDGHRLAWSSNSSGSYQIWVGGRAGEQPVQLTRLEAPGADLPRWSPDGRQIAFRGFQPGPEPDLYVMPAEGGPARRLTTGASSLSPPSWSSDRRWIYFSSASRGTVSVWRVPAAGGAAALVARPGRWPIASRDGATVYYAGAERGIWKSPADGSSAPVPLARDGQPPLRESPDGRFVFFRATEGGVWKVATAGGDPVPAAASGRRASWTSSDAGIYTLDPDAAGGPALAFVPLEGGRGAVAVRLGGDPDDFLEPVTSAAPAPAVSPDGGWIVFLRKDPIERKIMVVERF